MLSALARTARFWPKRRQTSPCSARPSAHGNDNASLSLVNHSYQWLLVCSAQVCAFKRKASRSLYPLHRPTDGAQRSGPLSLTHLITSSRGGRVLLSPFYPQRTFDARSAFGAFRPFLSARSRFRVGIKASRQVSCSYFDTYSVCRGP